MAQAAPPVIVRTVYQEGFPAKYNTADSARPGICIEVIHAIEKADPGLRFTGLDVRASTVRILRMLETHEIDVFVGIGRTPERETNLTWLTPPVFSAHPYLFVRKEDEANYHSMDEIRHLRDNNTILVNFGSVQDEYLQGFPDLNVDRGGTDTEKNLRKLMLGRGRFYFGSDLNTLPVINSLGIGVLVNTPHPFPRRRQLCGHGQRCRPRITHPPAGRTQKTLSLWRTRPNFPEIPEIATITQSCCRASRRSRIANRPTIFSIGIRSRNCRVGTRTMSKGELHLPRLPKPHHHAIVRNARSVQFALAH